MFIGFVGKPSSGKSTFFKASTLAEVEIANYPFTTIKPNSGVGYVKVRCVEEEFNTKCMPRTGYCIKHWRFVPVQLLDVAGLVPDAHLGKGRGNQFLDDLRQADVLIHVVDASGSLNAQGEPVPIGSHDPCDDVKFLEHELDMWYFGILNKGWEKFSRALQQEKKPVHKALATQLSGLKVTEPMVDEAIKKLNLPTDKPNSWTEPQMLELATLLRKQTKPIVIAANKMDKSSSAKNIERLRNSFPHVTIVPCSGEIELALREAAKKGLIDYIPGEDHFLLREGVTLSDVQRKGLDMIAQFLKTYGSSGVQQTLDICVFDVLKYIAIFPGGLNNLTDSKGNVLPDCFLLPPNSTALDFAFRIHTDIGNKFVRAMNVKTRLSIGKDVPLKHRDVIEIMTS